jgi:4-amino-4-deoxy-L-arabinose transferase-like glycosyltransferase
MPGTPESAAEGSKGAVVPLRIASRELPREVPWIAPALVLLVMAVRVAVLPRLGLFNDEAYYWEWSRRLAPSYFDHPPAVAYLIAASTALFGRTELAVHLPALLLSTLTSVVLYRLALDLFPGRRGLAWWAVALCNAAPLFGIGAVFTTPDAPCTFLWVTTAWLVWRATHGAPRLWYLAGVAAGLGLLSKYTYALLLPGLLLYLLHPSNRGWLRRREPWVAAATAALMFVPVLAWNHDRGWESFLFQALQRHGGSFRPWVTVPRYLAAHQTLTPLVWIASVAGLVRSARLARAGDDAHRFLFCCAIATLAFFTVWSLFTYVNANWFALGFLTAMVSAADLLERLRSPAARAAPALLAAFVTLFFYIQARTLVVPLPPGLDLATDLNGWQEVGARLRELKAEAPRPDRTFVASRRLQLSALAAFYGGDGLDVTRLWGRRDQYDEWIPADGRRGEDAIYFCDDLHFAPPDAWRFEACERAPDLPVVRWGRTIRTFSFWRCRRYQP